MYTRRNETLGFSHDGGVVISDTTATTPPAGFDFGAIQIINDAVIDEITLPDYTNENGLEDITILAGNVIYGRCTAITLTSGVVVAHLYKK